MLKRARLTDDIGWLGQQHLAALLPDTSPEGAASFAQGVAARMARHGPRPLAIVYAYPRDKAIMPVVASALRVVPQASDNKDRVTESPGHDPYRIGQSAAKANQAAEVAKPAAKWDMPVRGLEDLLAYPTPIWKRSLDIVGALMLIVVLSPVWMAAALAIKLSSPGPIIFKQRRSGLGGEPFTIYKFRTMVVDAEKRQQELRKLNEQDGPAFKLTRDPRVTRVGAFLRKTSIDELPQLLNVLQGNMSLVGPRPLPIKEQEGCEQWQRHRLNVTPGLTCIWQVKGRSQVTFAEWVRMDVEYIRRRTIFSDLNILLSTIPSVLLRKGAR